MFTGIVEEIGVIQNIKKAKNLCRLTIKAKKVLPGAKLGSSLAVDGVCLTVTKKDKTSLTFDIMRETIVCTTFKNLALKCRVNLERALKGADRFGGHFVTGHVDNTAKIIQRIKKPNYVELRISQPKGLAKYLVKKGSVCVNGVSLTIGKIGKRYFSVYLIPYTLKETTLGEKAPNDWVNVEADILARYVLKSC